MGARAGVWTRPGRTDLAHAVQGRDALVGRQRRRGRRQVDGGLGDVDLARRRCHRELVHPWCTPAAAHAWDGSAKRVLRKGGWREVTQTEAEVADPPRRAPHRPHELGGARRVGRPCNDVALIRDRRKRSVRPSMHRLHLRHQRPVRKATGPRPTGEPPTGNGRRCTKKAQPVHGELRREALEREHHPPARILR